MIRTAATALLLAQAAPQAGFPEWVSALLNVGVAGVFLLLLVTGRVVPQSQLDREVARADKLEEDRRELELLLREQVIPLVSSASEVQSSVVVALERLANRREP